MIVWGLETQQRERRRRRAREEEEAWMEALTQMASSTYSGLFCNIPKASYVSSGASWTQFSRHELGATHRLRTSAQPISGSAPSPALPLAPEKSTFPSFTPNSEKALNPPKTLLSPPRAKIHTPQSPLSLPFLLWLPPHTHT